MMKGGDVVHPVTFHSEPYGIGGVGYTFRMTHFICTGGCKGESSRPGTCQAIDCHKEGLPLDECDCVDGKHEPNEDVRKEAPAG